MNFHSLSICQIIVIFNRFSSELMVNHECFETYHGLFDGLCLSLSFSSEIIYLTVKINLGLLHFFLGDESWSTHSFLVVAHAIASGSSTKLWLVLGFFIHVILNLTVRLAIKDHLRPDVIFLENWNNILIVKILDTRRIHESTILETVVLELLFVSLRHIKGFQHLFIF